MRRVVPFVLVIFTTLALPLGLAFCADGVDDRTIQVGRSVPDGGSIELPIESRPIRGVDVVVRRESGTTDTSITAGLTRGMLFENGKRVQVDHETDHVLRFSAGGLDPAGSALSISAAHGTVRVVSVTVHYERATASRGAPPAGAGGGTAAAETSVSGGTCPANGQPPRIELASLRPSGGLFSGKYKATGAIVGACVSEAGYFEGGKLKSTIDIPPAEGRREFTVNVRSGRDGEIRVSTADGRRDVFRIDDRIAE